VVLAAATSAHSVSAYPLLARNECINGFWHTVTYDLANGGTKKIEDTKNEPSQPCSVATAAGREQGRPTAVVPLRVPYRASPAPINLPTRASKR
jgi:hypothetical protein